MQKYFGICIAMLHLFPTALVLVGCVIVRDKLKSNLTTALLVGQTITLFGSLIMLVLQFLFIAGVIPIQSIGVSFTIPSLVTIVGTFLFGFGFISLARKI